MNYFKQGIEAFKEQDVNEAIENLEKVESTDPNYADAQFHLMICYECTEESEKEDKAFDAIPTTHERYVEALFFKGLNARHMGEFEEAIEWYEKAPKESPLYYGAVMQKAVCYKELGETEKAIEVGYSVPEDSKYYSESMHAISHIYRAQKQFDKALEVLDKCDLTDGKTLGLVMIQKGFIYEDMGDIDAALAALASVPQDTFYGVRCVADRIYLLRQNDRKDETLSCFDNLDPSRANYAALMLLKAKELLVKHQFEDIVTLLEEVLEKEQVKDEDGETFIETLEMIARAYDRLDNQEKRLEYIELGNDAGRRLFKKGYVTGYTTTQINK